MAKINDGTFVDFKDGDKMTSDAYEQDRRILQVAINDNDSRIGSLTSGQNGIEGRVTTLESDNTSNKETLGTHDTKISTLESSDSVQNNRLEDVEDSLSGYFQPVTFEALEQQGTLFQDFQFGYLDSKIGNFVDGKLAPVVSDLAESTADLMSRGLNVKYPYGTNLTPATGDGVTDDTDTLQAFFDYQQGATIVIPDGTYIITRPLTINNDTNLLLSRNAKIKAMAVMSNMIIVNDQDRTPSIVTWTNDAFIKGGILDGNFMADNLLALDYYMGFILDGIKFLNCGKKALITRYRTTYTHELKASNLYFRNDQPIKNSIAIYNNGKDNIFTNIITRDFHQHIWSLDGLFSKVHGWIGFTGDFLQGSSFIISEDNYVMMDSCYADTFQYPFISRCGSFHISNSVVLFNNDIYTTALNTTYPIEIFRRENATYYDPSNKGYFHANGNVIHSYLPVKLVTVKDSQNIFNGNAIVGHGGAVIDQTNYTELSNQNISNNVNGTYATVQTVFANAITYGSYRAFIPLQNANQKTITLTGATFMSGNNTTDILATTTLGQRYQNGFVVQCTNVSVAGAVGQISFTVA